MKNLLLSVALGISLNSSAVSTPASSGLIISQQNNPGPAFSVLRGHKQGNAGYALQWSMTTSAGVDYYEIQSTYEDPFDEYSNWTTEGTVVHSRANVVKFTHQSPIPGFINYRVIAVSSNGGPNVVSGIYSTTIE